MYHEPALFGAMPPLSYEAQNAYLPTTVCYRVETNHLNPFQSIPPVPLHPSHLNSSALYSFKPSKLSIPLRTLQPIPLSPLKPIPLSPRQTRVFVHGATLGRKGVSAVRRHRSEAGHTDSHFPVTGYVTHSRES